MDRDGSGECEYPEFVEIMTLSLNKIREEQEKTGETQGPDISFELMATAYRRKRLMEGLMSGDRCAPTTIRVEAGLLAARAAALSASAAAKPTSHMVASQTGAAWTGRAADQ